MKNHIDFFLAGKKLGVIAVTATLLATQIGGGLFIGTAQNPFRGALYVLGIVISFIVLSMGIAEKFRSFNVETVAGIFEKQYNSDLLNKVCAALAIITLCGILLSQAIAMQAVVGNFTGTFTEYIFPTLWFVIILYTLLGGLKAVVVVDLVQVAIVITVFSGFFLCGLWTDPVPFFSTTTLPKLKTLFTHSNLPTAEIIRVLIISSCYSIITQDIAHRFFASKDQKTAGRAALYASIILLAFAIIPFYFGFKAHFLTGATAKNHSALFTALEQVASGIPLVIAMCALMAAITSTVDSLLCAVSAIFCSSSIPFLKNEKREILFSQLIIVVCGLSIFTGSYFIPKDVISMLINSYEVSVVCLFVPIIVACLKKKKDLNLTSAYLSVGFGLAGFIFSKLNTIVWLNSWTLLISLGLSCLGYLLGDLFFNADNSGVNA